MGGVSRKWAEFLEKSRVWIEKVTVWTGLYMLPSKIVRVHRFNRKNGFVRIVLCSNPS